MGELVKTNALPRRSTSYFAIFFPDDDNVPSGAYPPDIKLPAWKHWPVSQKLPRLNVGKGDYWSRGRLGQPLVASTSMSKKPDFVVSKTALKAPYDPLHDPSLERHFNKPVYKKVLLTQGLIDRRGYVKCTQKEQNEYRAFIGESSASQSQIEEFYEKQKAHEREVLKVHAQVLKELKHIPAKEAKWRRTYLKGQMIQEEKRKRAIKTSVMEQRRYQEQLRKFHEDRQRHWINRKVSIKGSKPLQYLRAREKELMDRIHLLRTIEFNEKLARVKRAQIAKEREMEKEEFMRLQWQRHLQFNFDNEDLTAAALEEEEQERKRKIQRRVTRTFVDYQRNMLHKIHKKQHDEERARALALKYGRRWLQKVRDRLEFEKTDGLIHGTSFEIHRLLDCQISKLCKDVGHGHRGILFGGVSIRVLLDKARASMLSFTPSEAELGEEEHEGMDEFVANLKQSVSANSMSMTSSRMSASKEKPEKTKPKSESNKE